MQSFAAGLWTPSARALTLSSPLLFLPSRPSSSRLRVFVRAFPLPNRDKNNAGPACAEPALSMTPRGFEPLFPG